MKKTILIIGGVLMVFGLAGFLPNPLVGARAFFVTDFIHNWLHILAGVFILVMALKSEKSGVRALRIFGIVFTLLAVVGFLSQEQKLLGIFVSNLSDTWLHFVLGALLLFYSQKFSFTDDKAIK